MSYGRGSPQVIPSVFDRLLADPENSHEPYSIPQLREDIRRDVECFLNTRLAGLDLPEEEFPELAGSILNYGRTDLGNLRTTQQIAQFQKSLEEGIRHFEPRFHSVTVKVDPPSPTDRTLKLTIHSTLRLQPNYSIDFDSNIDVASGQCLLRVR